MILKGIVLCVLIHVCIDSLIIKNEIVNNECCDCAVAVSLRLMCKLHYFQYFDALVAMEFIDIEVV